MSYEIQEYSKEDYAENFTITNKIPIYTKKTETFIYEIFEGQILTLFKKSDKDVPKNVLIKRITAKGDDLEDFEGLKTLVCYFKSIQKVNDDTDNDTHSFMLSILEVFSLNATKNTEFYWAQKDKRKKNRRSEIPKNFLDFLTFVKKIVKIYRMMSDHGDLKKLNASFVDNLTCENIYYLKSKKKINSNGRLYLDFMNFGGVGKVKLHMQNVGLIFSEMLFGKALSGDKIKDQIDKEKVLYNVYMTKFLKRIMTEDLKVNQVISHPFFTWNLSEKISEWKITEDEINDYNKDRKKKRDSLDKSHNTFNSYNDKSNSNLIASLEVTNSNFLSRVENKIKDLLKVVDFLKNKSKNNDNLIKITIYLMLKIQIIVKNKIDERKIDEEEEDFCKLQSFYFKFQKEHFEKFKNEITLPKLEKIYEFDPKKNKEFTDNLSNPFDFFAFQALQNYNLRKKLMEIINESKYDMSLNEIKLLNEILLSDEY